MAKVSLVLAIGEFAEALHVSTRTVRRLIDTGGIRAIRVAGVIRIPRSELERLLSSDARAAV